ncbi:FecR family protein [Legionella waltersii]|nr:FecR family protein [Legionella waltersii]
MKKVILVGLFLTINNAFAEDVATVLFASNKATVIRHNSETSLVRGAKLAVGDAIKTGPKSLVNIKYNNGTLVNLGDNSDYKIIAYSSKPNEVQVNAELSKGKLKFQTTGKSKEVLNTPIIALAIMGTSAHIYATSNGIYVNLADGQILAGNNSLPTNQTSLVNPNGQVSESQMPPEGNVETPSGSEGNVDISASSSSQSENEGPSPTVVEGVASVATIASTQVASETSGESATAVPAISIDCAVGGSPP